MKSILTLLICTISLYSSAQCEKLYIQEHSGGSRICNLSAGDYIEICEDENEVNGCPRNFYIYDKGYLSGSFTYELSLDRGWSTHYMTLMVNPKTKRIGFSLQGQNGFYSYITEKEMEIYREQEIRDNESKLKQKLKQETLEDKSTKSNIKDAIKNQKYFKAKMLYSKLYTEDLTLLKEIDKYYSQILKEMDELYIQYCKEFENYELEFYEDKNAFIKKNTNNIVTSKEIIDGEKGFLKRIENSPMETKQHLKDLLDNKRVLYHEKDGKHYLTSINVWSSYNVWLYSADTISLLVNYDNAAECYFLSIKFNFENKAYEAIVVNKVELETKKYIFQFNGKLDEYYKIAIKDGALSLIENTFPKKIIHIEYEKRFPFKSHSEIEKDENAKNQTYENLKNDFKFTGGDIAELCKEKSIMTVEFQYNPMMIYLVKKMFPNADSMIYVIGDEIIAKELGSQAFHVRYSSEYFGSIVPIQKGVLEYRNNTLRLFLESGEFKEINLKNVIPQSEFELNKFKFEESKLDKTFMISPKYNYHYPFIYSQLELHFKDNLTFYVNDSLICMKFPVYSTSDFYSHGNESNVYESHSMGRPIDFIPTYKDLNPNQYPTYDISFNFYRSPNEKGVISNSTYSLYSQATKEIDKLNYLGDLVFIYLKSYLDYMSQGKSKKALKSLSKADKYIEEFKNLYYNLEYY